MLLSNSECPICFPPKASFCCPEAVLRLITYLTHRSPFVPQLNSPMNPVSSSEDIKPQLGLNGVMKVPAQPSSTALSHTKHICAICGDRSSGESTVRRLSPLQTTTRAVAVGDTSTKLCLRNHSLILPVFLLVGLNSHNWLRK